MEGKFCYRMNGERFEGSFDTREDAALEFAALYPENVDEGKCTVETAVCRVPKIESLLPDIEDHLLENAYDSGGEWSENWSFTKEQSDDLQSRVEKAVREWADEHKCHPDWFEVEDIQATTVTIDDGSL